MFVLTTLVLIGPETLFSHKISPPANSCNAPLTGVATTLTCAQANGCHQPAQQPYYLPSNPDTLSLLIDTSPDFVNHISLNDSFQYADSTVYYIKFQLYSTTGVYGFQIIPETGNTNMAGSFTVLNSTNTYIVKSPPTGNHQYMGHSNADSTKTWIFQWTSPPTTAGPITFYYAYNTSTLAFADSTPPMGYPHEGVPGRQIYVGSALVSPLATGINTLPSSVSSLNVLPNPTEGNFDITFGLNQSETVSMDVYSMDGKLAKQLLSASQFGAGNFRQSFNVSAFPAGIYMLHIKIGDSVLTRKLIKL